MEKVIIFGLGPLSKTIFEIAKDIINIEIVGFAADDDYCNDEMFCGIKIYKLSELLNNNEFENFRFVLCIGYKSMRNRKLLFDKLKNYGFQFTNIIHPSVIIVKPFEIGENNIIFPGVVIENNVRIGNNNIIWSQTLIGHDAQINNHNYIAAKVLFGGNCKMQDLCFIGNAVFMINDLHISNESYIIAGSGLFNNIENKSLKFIGNPARKIGNHIETGIIIE